jgi:chondroitin 4-sulfotransferase 11
VISPAERIKTITEKMNSIKYAKFKKAFTENVTGLIIVRHPFHRLLSAYRDKFERDKNNNLKEKAFYNVRYGQKMVSTYRAAALKRFGPKFFAAENNFGTPLPVKGYRSAKFPTFWELVQYVKHQPAKTLDNHLKPVTFLCSLCTVEYNTIFHTETLEEEKNEVIRVLKIDPKILSQDSNQNVNRNFSQEEMFALYAKQLPDDDFHGLYRVYENDFKAFGYTFSYGNVTLPKP